MEAKGSKAVWKRLDLQAPRTRREQTIILGNKPVVIDSLFKEPREFTSRQELRKVMNEQGVYSPYFSD